MPGYGVCLTVHGIMNNKSANEAINQRMAGLNGIAPCLARYNVIMGGRHRLWRGVPPLITVWATTARKRTAAGVADGIQRLGSPCGVEWHFPVVVDTLMARRHILRILRVIRVNNGSRKLLSGSYFLTQVDSY